MQQLRFVLTDAAFLVEEIVHGMDRGVRWFAVDWWYCGVFEALSELIDGGGRHCRGGRGSN